MKFARSLESAFLGSPRLAPDWESEADRSIADACPRCGRTVGLGEVGENDRCPQCEVESVPWDTSVRLGEYDGELRETVLGMKFRGDRTLARVLGEALGERIRERLSTRERPAERVVLVPVPMPTLRRMQRGIDHTTAIARAAAESADFRLMRLLSRRGVLGGRSQRTVVQSKRAANVRGRFACAKVELEPESTVVVVDDVRTTGATMAECVRTVRKAITNRARGDEKLADFEVWGACLAVAPDPGRRRRSDVNDAVFEG